MTLAEIRELYHNGDIPKTGRSEIIEKFTKRFGYSNNQRFKMRMAIGSMEIPTPDEFTWLEETIPYYNNYYRNIQTSLVS
jgi:hypothetical protein